MITVRKVFIQRVISEWKYQYEVWKTVVDWIVVLYIVIPFLYIFIETYLSRLIRYSLAYPLSYSNCADAGWNRCIFVVAG